MIDKDAQHIVIVSSEFPPQPGGIGNHAFHLAKHLQAEGKQVTVITDNRSIDGLVEKEFDIKNEFETIRIKVSSPRFPMYFKRIKTLFALMDSKDVLIASGKFSLWNVALCSMFKKIKSIAIIHGTEVNFQSFLLKHLVNASLKRFHHIVAVSNFTKSLVSNLNHAVVVIPNGIDFNHWQATTIQQKSKNHLTLVTVGRISKRKGQQVVIGHLNSLKTHFEELTYHCIGIADDSEGIRDLIEKEGLTSQVRLHGVLEDHEMRSYLSRSHIFVMLSSSTDDGDVEGFGIAILEANAMGLPAIGAKGSGIEDAIKDGYSGVLINGRDSIEFSNAVRQIYENYNIYSENAKQWAQQHDWKILIKQYLAIIE